MTIKTSSTNSSFFLLSLLAGVFSGACVVGAGAGAGTTPVSGPATQAAHSPAAVQASASDATRTGTVVCQGGEDIVLENEIIEASGDGVVAEGACSVTLINTEIRAGGWALRVEGAGDVFLTNSLLKGQGAVMIEGAATIHSKGSTLNGRVVVEGAGDLISSGSTFNGDLEFRGAGEYVDQGGNTRNR